MAHLIDKDALVAKIEKLKLCTMDEHMNFYNDKAKEDYSFLSEIEELIKALQEEPINHNNLNIMLDEALSNETSETWNERLNEEPANNNLEKELDKYIQSNFTIDTEQLDRFGIEERDYMYSMDKSDILSLVEHFVNWQKTKKEPVSEELEEVCKKLAENARKHKAETSSPFFSPTDYKQGVIDGAAWQKQKDSIVSEGLEDAMQHNAPNNIGIDDLLYWRSGFIVGANWQIAKLIKDATEVTVHIEAGNYPYIPQLELYDYDKDVPLAKEGDKYKVVLIKED